MNILNLLQLLSEDRTLDNIQKQFNNKVPSEVIDSLASKVKKGKFDNEAMAILKGLQQDPNVKTAYSKEEHDNREYLISHAAMVYSILKKLKRGESDFDAEKVVSNFLNNKRKPSTFWKEKYEESSNKPAPLSKEEKKFNTVGLDTARTKDLGDCFAILPKNFKTFDPEYGYKTFDYPKSQEEMKKLSSDMARRDTSGKEGARVNHWCVAASSTGMFRNYKRSYKEPNEFVIFVEKNDDGSPNWNHRWLAYFNKDRIEIADKFNKHTGVGGLPSGAQKFFTKMMEQKLNRSKKKPNEFKEIDRRLDTRDEREVVFSGDSENARKLLDYIYSVIRKAKRYKATQIKSYLKKALKTLGINSFSEFKGASGRGVGWFQDAYVGKYAGIFQEKVNLFAFNMGPFRIEGKTPDKVKAMLDKCVADPTLIEKNIDENLEKSKSSNYKIVSAKKAEYSEPTEKMMRSLGGNKKIADKYFEYRGTPQLNKQFIIPSPYTVKDDHNIVVNIGTFSDPNMVIVNYGFRFRKIGDKDDPETLEKLKAEIEKIFNSQKEYGTR